MSSSPFPASKRAKTVAASILAAFFIIGGTYYVYKSHIFPNPSKNQAATRSVNRGSDNTSQNSSNSQVVAVNSTPSATGLPAIKGLSVYNSSANHVGFYFDASKGFATKEQGNTITIYDTNQPDAMQYVEVFTKSPTDTIAQAITKAVLGGYNPSDCPIGAASTDGYKYPSNLQFASIHYSSNNIDQYGNPINPSKCPAQYTANKDILYFLTDKNHPDRLLFFHIGQYGIPAGSDSKGNALSWQDTISLF